MHPVWTRPSEVTLFTFSFAHGDAFRDASARSATGRLRRKVRSISTVHQAMPRPPPKPSGSAGAARSCVYGSCVSGGSWARRQRWSPL